MAFKPHGVKSTRGHYSITKCSSAACLYLSLDHTLHFYEFFLLLLFIDIVHNTQKWVTDRGCHWEKMLPLFVIASCTALALAQQSSTACINAFNETFGTPLTSCSMAYTRLVEEESTDQNDKMMVCEEGQPCNTMIMDIINVCGNTVRCQLASYLSILTINIKTDQLCDPRVIWPDPWDSIDNLYYIGLVIILVI